VAGPRSDGQFTDEPQVAEAMNPPKAAFDGYLGARVKLLGDTVFAQPSQQVASQAIYQALELLDPRSPKVARLLRDAEHDILSSLVLPSEHWRSIRSTNTLERVNAEIDRRAKLLGIFPNCASLRRLPPRFSKSSTMSGRMAAATSPNTLWTGLNPPTTTASPTPWLPA